MTLQVFSYGPLIVCLCMIKCDLCNSIGELVSHVQWISSENEKKSELLSYYGCDIVWKTMSLLYTESPYENSIPAELTFPPALPSVSTNLITPLLSTEKRTSEPSEKKDSKSAKKKFHIGQLVCMNRSWKDLFIWILMICLFQ